MTCDFAGEMVKRLGERFEKSDFAQIPGYKAVIDTKIDYSSNGERIDLDAVVAAQSDFKKLVLGYRASGTALPYPDKWFDAYISNLCL